MKELQKLLGIFLLAVTAFGQSLDRYSHKIEIGFLSGVSLIAPKPVLVKDWERMFTPPKTGMTLGGGTHPLNLGFELRVTPTLRASITGWSVGLPISYLVWSDTVYGRGTKGYFGGKGVAGTYLRWWDSVMVNDIAAQNFSPRVGIELTKGRVSVTPSVQHYRLMARDFKGKDCVNCRNTSSVINSRQLESGVSPRFELMFDQGKNRPVLGTARIGLFVEGFGTKVWTTGLILRWQL